MKIVGNLNQISAAGNLTFIEEISQSNIKILKLYNGLVCLLSVVELI